MSGRVDRETGQPPIVERGLEGLHIFLYRPARAPCRSFSWQGDYTVAWKKFFLLKIVKNKKWDMDPTGKEKMKGYSITKKISIILPVIVLLISILILGASCKSEAKDTEIILATTTSTYDSGLLDELLPIFEEEYGYEVQKVINEGIFSRVIKAGNIKVGDKILSGGSG